MVYLEKHGMQLQWFWIWLYFTSGLAYRYETQYGFFGGFFLSAPCPDGTQKVLRRCTFMVKVFINSFLYTVYLNI